MPKVVNPPRMLIAPPNRVNLASISPLPINTTNATPNWASIKLSDWLDARLEAVGRLYPNRAHPMARRLANTPRPPASNDLGCPNRAGFTLVIFQSALRRRSIG